jgi:cobalt/nickel transport system ATP-binding protein
VVSALEITAARLGWSDSAAVLHDVRLAIAPGERVAIVGGNGAGKTTLLRAMAGLGRLQGGHLTIRGHAVKSAGDAVSAGLGLLFQNPDDQLFGATAIDDAAFGPRNQGLPDHEAIGHARAALAEVGATHLADRPIETLSFGEKKRVGLAGVLAMRPEVLLLDEPTAGLDPAGERALVRLLLSLGRTLVIATHAMDLLPWLATRVVVLGGGRVVADGPATEVLGEEHLLERASLRAPFPTRDWWIRTS